MKWSRFTKVGGFTIVGEDDNEGKDLWEENCERHEK